MEAKGVLEIRVIGEKGNEPLSPLNTDVKEIKTMLETMHQI